jgi:amino acid transporter
MYVILYLMAILTYLTLLTTFSVGLLSQARHALVTPDDLTFPIHFYLGLFSVLMTLAVHCLVFIYFLGTGRWVKEVALAYKLPDAPLPKLTRELKRWTFPVALTAMLVSIATAAAGTAAQRREWPWTVHFSLAVVTLLVNLWAFWVELRNVHINASVIDDVMREVDRIRSAQGLPCNAEALRQAQSRGE